MSVNEQSPTPGPRRIALAFPASQAHLHAVVRGIVDYTQQYERWLVMTSVEAATLHIESLAGWRGDGVIAIVTTDAEAKAAQRLQRTGVPVVTFSGSLKDPGIPKVLVDNRQIGRLAADHLMARGFRRFGFYGVGGREYAILRARAFLARVQDGGGQATEHWAEGNQDEVRPWQHGFDELEKWLESLEKPVGVFAMNDFRARLVIDACSMHRLRIPEDVGLVGVDNNQVVCEFSDPPLTSVQCDWRRLGFECARLLDRLMRGKTPPEEEVLVPALGVVRRESTDVTHTDDARVAQAVDYLREHLGEVFGVERLVTVTGVSRRSLEEAFQREFKCSPYRFLSQTRVDRAKELLSLREKLKLSEVARRCGFPHARGLRETFQRLEGVSPTEFETKASPACAR
jgi:LacI family transcriptional regulator